LNSARYIFFFFILLTLSKAQNNFPIVLIHGFMGWGPDEMGDYNYWGGEDDFVSLLEEQGHVVFELSVGPVSSNWERAIEVYYQLKGGQTDYGKRHANKYNIIQKPKDKYYDSLYPEWSNENPIHIIAHSMGGQTARMLNYLLTQEIYQDDGNEVRESSLLLGQSQEGLIKSITTIATPHDGTTLTSITIKIIPFIQYFIGVAGLVGTDFYNFDLEQWGFRRKKSEAWFQYVNRMREHPAWKTKNISSWDLSLDGAKELNGFLQASPEIYYFSFITTTTVLDDHTGLHTTTSDTPLLIRSRAKLMGSRSGYWPDGSPTDSSWYENDGVVNTVSMYGPSTGVNGSDPIVEYEKNELLMPGQWYWTKINNMDHWSMIGHFKSKGRSARGRIHLINHAKILKTLPLK
tara:strand:+ start:1263 stop:2474 length:1212 start_codon:yes stop_codon:yes gene_type:complete